MAGLQHEYQSGYATHPVLFRCSKKTKPFASFCCDDVNMYGPGERRRSTTPDEVKRGSKLVELGEAKISSLVLDVSICIPVSLLVVQERREVKYVAYRTCMTVWYLQFM